MSSKSWQGVLAGEHRHSDLESDLLLEGSQVLYWVAVCAAILGHRS